MTVWVCHKCKTVLVKPTPFLVLVKSATTVFCPKCKVMVMPEEIKP
jgi:RNase P subunit RPR2